MIQCHRPLPTSASGSNRVTAKLLVPAGAPLQFSAGETLPPLHPEPLESCSALILPPSAISGLVTRNSPALAAAAAVANPTANPIASARILPRPPPCRYGHGYNSGRRGREG